MTNAEHLIENAIVDIDKGKDFEHFASQKHNKLMSKISGISLNAVWEMGQHIVWSLRPTWLSAKESEMEELYGYSLDQRV